MTGRFSRCLRAKLRQSHLVMSPAREVSSVSLGISRPPTLWARHSPSVGTLNDFGNLQILKLLEFCEGAETLR